MCSLASVCEVNKTEGAKNRELKRVSSAKWIPDDPPSWRKSNVVKKLGDILFHIGIIIVKARVKPGISILITADLNVGELSGVSVVPSSLSAGVSPELSAMTSSLSELGGFSA
jgi:hypothetical protein